MRVDAQNAEYDVVIVGSGAGGGMSAYVLTMSGLKVLMLEAGRAYDPVSETPMFNLPKDAPLRAAPTPDKPFGYFDATVDGGWEVPGEPYSQGSTEEARQFKWWRARMLGEPLGPNLIENGRVRFQALFPRWFGFRLADRLRGPGALL